MEGNLTSVSDFPRTYREFVQKFPVTTHVQPTWNNYDGQRFLLSGLSNKWNTLASDAGSDWFVQPVATRHQ